MAKVLIVEDSAAQAAIMSDIVRNAGHEPTIANNLQKGVAQLIKSAAPDVVLLDLMLLGADGKPLADGFVICREIKRVSNNKVGVVIVSANSDEDSAEWAVLQGADAFLQKPFAVDDLVDVMNEVLSNLAKK